MKTIKFIILPFLLSCLLIFPIFGQAYENENYYVDTSAPPLKPEYFAVGIRIGMDINTLRGLDKISVPGYDRSVPAYKVRSQLDISFGVTGQIIFYNQLLVQLDLSLVTVGTNLKYINEDESQPMLDYHFQPRLLFGSKRVVAEYNGERLVFLYGIGPYLGISVGSSPATKDDPFASNDEFDMGELNLHKIDYGLSAMIGIECNGFQATLHYDHGIRNLARDASTMNTSSLRISIGCIFDL